MTVTALTHDTVASRTGVGLVLAVASATSFGLSGVLARGLLDTGWSAGATVALRIAIAAAVLVVPGALAVRGRWHLVTTNAGLVTIYGVAAVAGAVADEQGHFRHAAMIDHAARLRLEQPASYRTQISCSKLLR